MVDRLEIVFEDQRLKDLSDRITDSDVQRCVTYLSGLESHFKLTGKETKREIILDKTGKLFHVVYLSEKENGGNGTMFMQDYPYSHLETVIPIVREDKPDDGRYRRIRRRA